MCMIKAPTIMKQNPLIMAEFEKAFSEVDHDVINILLHELQNEYSLDGSRMDLFNYSKILDRKVVIPAKKFKDLGRFGKNSRENIYQSLKKISDTSATIRDFRDHNNKWIYAQNVRIIDGAKHYSLTEDNREQAFEVQFNEWFLQIATKQFNIQVGNYTKIEIEKVSEVKGKHAKKLFELLQSKQFRETSFSMPLAKLQKIFNLEDKDFSYMVRIIKTNAPKVNKAIPFTFEPFKADKLISFSFL